MNVEEILAVEFLLIKEELIQSYDDKGMRSSGKWADALRIEVEKESVRLTGLGYSEQLEHGRKAGKRPPVEVIEEWIQAKGIQTIDSNISTRSLAFIIARKIGEEGWKREKHGGVELISEIITPARIQKILNKVTDAQIINVSSEIIDIFSKAFK